MDIGNTISLSLHSFIVHEYDATIVVLLNLPRPRLLPRREAHSFLSSCCLRGVRGGPEGEQEGLLDRALEAHAGGVQAGGIQGRHGEVLPPTLPEVPVPESGRGAQAPDPPPLAAPAGPEGRRGGEAVPEGKRPERLFEGRRGDCVF